MEYRTVIFEESKWEVVREWLIVGGIVLATVTLFVIKVTYLSRIGIISITSLGYWLYKTKIDAYKANGINSYGEKKAQLILSLESIIGSNPRRISNW